MPSTTAIYAHNLDTAAFNRRSLMAALPLLARMLPVMLLMGIALAQGPRMFPDPLDAPVVVLLLWVWSEICIRLLPRRAAPRSVRRPLQVHALGTAQYH